MANIDKLVFQPLEYIEPKALLREELEYELRIRGVREISSLDDSLRVRSLMQIQRDELRDGQTTQTRVPGFEKEKRVVCGTLTEIDKFFNLRQAINMGAREKLVYRLIHLLNRSRRILVQNDSQHAQRQALVNRVTAKIRQWRRVLANTMTAVWGHENEDARETEDFRTTLPPHNLSNELGWSQLTEYHPVSAVPMFYNEVQPTIEVLHESNVAKLWHAVHELQSQLAELKQTAERPAASTPQPQVPSHGNVEQTALNNVSERREDESEDVVRRYGSRVARFATRKQIAPHRWGFTFSGEERGSKRDTTPQNFLALVEANRQSEGYSKGTMLTYMSILLVGTAKGWWLNNQRQFTSYDQFIYEFQQEWFPIDFEQTAFIDLCSYKQKDEPVLQYLNSFQTRVNYCNPTPSEDQVISIDKRNICEEFRDFLVIMKPQTFAEVKRVCREQSEMANVWTQTPSAERDEDESKREVMDMEDGERF